MSIGVLSVNTDQVYQAEECPFDTVIVDVTHRCNMQCKNCYIPNRDIPDMDHEWFASIMKRLPPKRYIRIVGAEPTLHPQLLEMIKATRQYNHRPILLTNGLRLADPAMIQPLKEAGLRMVYLSFNGGFNDESYLEIDEMRAATKKKTALENLVKANMYIALGMIIVRGVNEGDIRPVFEYAKQTKQVRELKLRSVGQLGRYMDTKSFKLDELIDLFQKFTKQETHDMETRNAGEYMARFKKHGLVVQMTQWPELNSKVRGRLAPDGSIQPFFEHVLANEGGY